MALNYHRKHFFINKEMQGKYIFAAFLSVALGGLVFALLFGFFSSNTLSIVYDNYHLRLGTTPELLLNKILNAQWVFVFLVGIGIAILTLFLSHRVAGPLFRFEKTLDAMISKDLSEHIRLRKNDEGTGLVEKINGFNQMLSSELRELRRISQGILACCGDLEAGGTAGGLDQKISEIKQYQSDMDRIVDGFKLMSE